jgi:hypothetical protein
MKGVPMEINIKDPKTDYREVKITRDVSEANKLLSEGWELMNAGVSHTDSTGYQAKCHFILAMKKPCAQTPKAKRTRKPK